MKFLDFNPATSTFRGLDIAEKWFIGSCVALCELSIDSEFTDLEIKDTNDKGEKVPRLMRNNQPMILTQVTVLLQGSPVVALLNKANTAMLADKMRKAQASGQNTIKAIIFGEEVKVTRKQEDGTEKQTDADRTNVISPLIARLKAETILKDVNATDVSKAHAKEVLDYCNEVTKALA